MIDIINLSYPRKIVVDKINNLIFESRVSTIKLNMNIKIIGCTIGIVFFSKHLVYAHTSVENSTKIINFFNYYGPPLILTATDFYKLYMPIKIHKKNVQL
ncbi:hypothetical protein KPL37_18900 [Clostridium frigoris]|uniref:Uncharacterized protein n=1 Tax=Clostridium frigoris TaxID=205327 RepID=A0ABS6BYQ4_9CLOT|nr:hypothetical protein [Clostridium frigoris]MBU3161757.1 hypothetical protein [Clostridium frigoris]